MANKWKDRIDVVTDEMLLQVFQYANFGPNPNHRELVAKGILQKLAGYACGGTLTHIMRDIGFITLKGNVTRAGREFCFDWFCRRNVSE